MKQIVGRKMGMTEVFAQDGTMYAVTVVEVLPNVVTQVKTTEKDGYDALQVGIEEKKESKVNKAEKGHFEKAGVKATKVLMEIKGDEMLSYKVGDEIKADIFAAGDKIDASQKATVEDDIKAVKDILDRTKDQEMSDSDLDALKAAKEKLTNDAQALFTKMYENMQAAQGGQAGPNMGGTAGESANGGEAGYDDVVDADYKEV